MDTEGAYEVNKRQDYTEESFSLRFLRKNNRDRNEQKYQEHQNHQELSQEISTDERSKIFVKKLVQMVAYIPFLWIIGLIIYPIHPAYKSDKLDKLDKSLEFHINQGILLTIAYFVVDLVFKLLNIIFVSIDVKLLYFSLILFIVSKISILILIAIGMNNVYTSSDKSLPIIGKTINFFD